ncbi:dihydropteridine reductase [Enterococcus saccharolyticus]|uniref:dihydropteridine reductase n=1 Tax=Enterococcus TaxID=1350 RepID=UPI001E2CF03F|nr:dihydropteridine reductase [Enterococcus saccharolyticus]MCD5003535.1 dihydropteridine reductase [Enterococcus saccharolyticus]
MQIYWTKINQIIEETPEVKTFLLDCPEDYSWKEGSHLHLALKGFNIGEKPNRSLVRHMSISTLPNENAVGITTRIKEQASEFKTILNNMTVGEEVALFKTHTHVPLKRENKNIYLLSAGVGIATFRPLVLDYLADTVQVAQIHSLNIDSSGDYLFTNIFHTNTDKNFRAEFVNNRLSYYEQVKELASDKTGLYYVVGSDEFLVQTVGVLTGEGIHSEQIILDKHEHQLSNFLPFGNDSK